MKFSTSLFISVVTLCLSIGLALGITHTNVRGVTKFGATVNTRFVGSLPTYLSGAGISTSATSIGVTSATIKQTGQVLSISDFGTTAYLTLEPGNSSRQEFVSCTGLTQNTNGTAVFTSCTRGLAPIYPYTSSTTLAFTHSGGTTVIISNSPPFYNNFAVQNNDATVTATWIFPSTTPPRYDSVGSQALGTYISTTSEFVSWAGLQKVAITGAANATEALQGLVELGTAAEQASSTQTGGTGASTVMRTAYATDTPQAKCNTLGSASGSGCTIIASLAGKIKQAWIDLTDTYAWTGPHSFSATTTVATTTRTGAEVGTFGLSVGTTTATSSGNVVITGTASTTNLIIDKGGVFNGWASSTAYEIVSTTDTLNFNASDWVDSTVSCSSGKVALGGGYNQTTAGNQAGWGVYASGPVGNNQWRVAIKSTSGNSADTFTIYAICVKI